MDLHNRGQFVSTLLLLCLLKGVAPCTNLQTCLHCALSSSDCSSIEESNGDTESQCITHLGTAGVDAVEYTASTQKCRVGFGCGLVYSSTAVTGYRYTCNTDCLTFELTVQIGVRQGGCGGANSAYEVPDAGSEADCVLRAFETYIGIIMHHVSSSGSCRMCYNCGTTCSTSSSPTHNTYTKICEPTDCGPLSDISFGSVSTGSTTSGATATYSCEGGYSMTGSSTRTCTSSGTWDGSEPSCSLVDCGPLSDITFGSVSTGSTTSGATATYSCEGGYSMTGSSTRTCTSSGTWDGSEPSCSLVDCGPLSDISFGSVSTGSTTSGATATYSCEGGYSMTGSSTRNCTSSGTWDGSEPSCSLVDCGPLSDITFGSVSTGSTTSGATATYSCEGGYSMTGSSTRTCTSSGTWDGSEPLCSLVDCGPLSDISFGSVSTGPTTSGATATYSCEGGYSMTGSSTRTCTSSGTWDGSEPSCNIVDCGSLSSISFGIVGTSGATTYEATATYSCEVGYNMTGTNTRTCTSSGSWDGSEPSCSIVDCGSPISISFGSVVTDGSTTYSAIATYSCEVGYNMTGANSRACEATGVWDGSEPSCNIVDCGSPTSISFGSVVTDGSTTYGAIATFSCEVLYVLTGNSTRTCSSSGMWDGTPPTCDVSFQAQPVATASVPVKLYIAACLCYPNKTFEGLTQEEIIDQLVADTAIDTTQTALAVNKRVSVRDGRSSSFTIGIIASVFLTFVFGGVVVLDGFRVARFLVNQCSRFRTLE